MSRLFADGRGSPFHGQCERRSGGGEQGRGIVIRMGLFGVRIIEGMRPCSGVTTHSAVCMMRSEGRQRFWWDGRGEPVDAGTRAA
jgi:hypothetical protein